MRRPLLAAAALGAVLGSCALVDAWLGPALIDDDELCEEVRRIWAGCSVDLSNCRDVVECAREKRSQCADEWDRWVRCLQDEGPSCAAAEAGEPFPCAGEYQGYLTCHGNGNLSEGEGMVLSCLQGLGSSCGNGTCEPGLGDTPQDCPQDCEANCPATDDGGAVIGLCTPFRAGNCQVCTCLEDGACNPLTENDFTCADCSCDQNGHCDAGESVWGCPGDCACDFDGMCDDGDNETVLSCSDCAGCDSTACAGAEDEPCSIGIGCRVPLVCDDGDLRCRLPCMHDNICPAGKTCSSNLCVP